MKCSTTLSRANGKPLAREARRRGRACRAAAEVSEVLAHPRRKPWTCASRRRRLHVAHEPAAAIDGERLPSVSRRPRSAPTMTTCSTLSDEERT